MPVIKFDNGYQQVYKNSVVLKNIIENTQPKIIKSLIAVVVNNQFANLDTIISKDSNILLIQKNDHSALNFIRYTCTQILGYAIKKIWPNTKLVQNNITEYGFYYDIDLSNRILEKDLFLLEENMHDIIKKSYKIFNKKVSYNEALKIFNDLSETYKIDLIKNLTKQNKQIFLYFHEKYIDLDIGLQVFNVKFCKYFKLQNISGVYWKGNNKYKMLQRIYGTAWNNKKNLDQHINYINEIEKRDHRKLGKNLQLYHFQEESPGMVFWHPYGWIIFHELEKFVRKKLQEYNYQEVKTPLLMDQSIWKKTGHWDHYKDSMFITASENREYCIKPMNCPGHVQIFNTGLKSYRNLPMRIAEFGSCHRNEPSGSLHGLMRIRHFTQDDAHIFCTKEQIRTEINNCIKMIYDLYSIFNFKKILVKLSTRPDKRIGSDILWDQAEKDLSDMLLKNQLIFEYQIGEGAFYGPKIEFTLQDSLGRNWQCGTIQLDFYLPTRLDSYYIDENNIRQTPVLIHRAILGSIERFIGILIEETSGKLPIWLSPVQVIIISISNNQIDYVKNVMKQFSTINVRVEIDLRHEKIGFKIREHTLRRIPYIVICGAKEMMTNTISVRSRNGHNFGITNVNSFIKILKKEILTYSFS